MTSPPDPPTVSVVIAARPGAYPEQVLLALERLKYPAEKIEAVVVTGTNPSAQRNHAVAQSRGALIHFLDDDSMVHPNLLNAVVDGYEEFPEANVVGGPALTSGEDSPFQVAVGAAMGSAFGLGPARYRHTPQGLPRPASERDLILCNLNVKRQAFERSGGLDPRLYPNEENEFLDRLRAAGVHLIHHPLAVVFRPRRRRLIDFIVQHLKYGRGRLEQVLIRPLSLDAVYAAPILFCCYLASLPWLPRPLGWLPLMGYACLAFASALLGAVETRQVATLLWLPILFPLMHVSYGAGMVWAISRKLFPPKPLPAGAIEIVRVKELGESFAEARDRMRAGSGQVARATAARSSRRAERVEV